MILALLPVLMLQAAPTAAPVCTAVVPPPAGLEAWSSAGSADPSWIGHRRDVGLSPVAGLAFPLAPGRPPAAGTNGAVAQFSIKTAGTYRIALGAGAWIDVVRDGKSLSSAGHTEGPACSGIRKIVDFDLTAGNYTLQISGSKAQTMQILITLKK